MRPSLTAGCLVALSLLAGGCVSLSVNSIANGRAPRVQAAVILAFAAVEAAISYETAKAAMRGDKECHAMPGSTEDFYTAKSSCTGPFDNALAAVGMGIPATIDVGVAIYQLITNRPAYKYKPRARRKVPAPVELAPPAETAPLTPDLGPPAETAPVAAIGYVDREACLRDRAEQQRRALRVTDIDERTRLLKALPDCSGRRAN